MFPFRKKEEPVEEEQKRRQDAQDLEDVRRRQAVVEAKLRVIIPAARLFQRQGGASG